MIHSSIKGFAAGGSFLVLGQAIAPAQVQFVVVLAATVGAVVGAVAWLDNRIEKKIAEKFTTHEEVEKLHLDALRDTINDLKDEVRAHRPSSNPTLGVVS